MDINSVAAALQKFISKEGSAFAVMAKTEAQALEVGSLLLAVEHYRRSGFAVELKNLQGGLFKIKLSARGYPRNFSWYEVRKDGCAFEIHGNLSVHSAIPEDGGIYVVDVGVLNAGTIPMSAQASKGWQASKNLDLITFIEAKKLVIYPMLLAQFVGIVHEIKPDYLAPAAVPPVVGSFYPALVSVGYLKGTARQIVDAYPIRGFRINIVPTFDEYIVRMAGDQAQPSPFQPSPIAVDPASNEST